MSSTEELLQGLKSSNAAERAEAAEGLGESGDSSAAVEEALVAALDDSVAVVAAAAALALGELGLLTQVSANALTPLLRHSNDLVRSAAKVSLSRIFEQDPEASSPEGRTVVLPEELTEKIRKLLQEDDAEDS